MAPDGLHTAIDGQFSKVVAIVFAADVGAWLFASRKTILASCAKLPCTTLQPHGQLAEFHWDRPKRGGACFGGMA